MNDAYSDYIRSVRAIPLLTPAEEIHLGTLVQRWKSALNNDAILERRGRRAMQRMIRANLRLVISISLRHQRRIAHLQQDAMDLIQAGNIGLIQAVQRFDPSRGYRFSTYGYWWIQQAVQNHLQEHGHLIRVPNPLLELAARANQMRQQARTAMSTAELAVALEVPPRRLERALAALRVRQLVPLDRDCGHDEVRGTLLDWISDGREPLLPEDYRWLHAQLEQLSRLERQILDLRYFQEQKSSLADVSRETGLSQYKVQRHEQRALAKLRQRVDATDRRH
jgi:RNA polymerase sigma factor (sigma-70 family)